MKQYYRCNLAKYRGPQCAHALHVLFHATNLKVSIYRTLSAHTHFQNARKETINSATKAYITDIYQTGLTKPSLIIISCERKALVDLAIVAPESKNLYNFLAGLKTKIFGKTQMNLADLMNWC